MAGVVEGEGRAVGDAFGERHVFFVVATPGEQTYRSQSVAPDAQGYADVGTRVGATQGFEDYDNSDARDIAGSNTDYAAPRIVPKVSQIVLKP